MAARAGTRPISACPNCGLWNFASTAICECGYNFISGDAPGPFRSKANKFPIPGNFVAFMIWLSFHTLVGWIIFFPTKAWVNSMQAGWEVVLLYAVGGVLLFNIVFVVILVGSYLDRKR
jgi:hypothetical protein